MPSKRRAEPESPEWTPFQRIQEEYRKLRERWGGSYLLEGDEKPLRKRIHEKLTASADPGLLDLDAEAACAQLLNLALWGPEKPFPQAMIRHWIVSAGAGFAIRAAARSWVYERPAGHLDRKGIAEPRVCPSLTPRTSWFSDPDKLGQWHALRTELAEADPAAYSDARSAAAELRASAPESLGEGSVFLRAALSYVFPREPEWALEAADELLAARSNYHYGYCERHPWCLVASLRDSERAEKIVATWGIYRLPRFFEFAPALVENVGASAVGPLRRLASSPCPESYKAPVYKLLSRFQTPEVALWFAQNLEGSKALSVEAASYLTRNPSLAIPALASVLASSSSEDNAASSILTRHLVESKDVVETALAGLSERERSRVERLGRKVERLEAVQPSEEETEYPDWLSSTDAKLPRKMPSLWTPSMFPRPRVSGGRALSSDAIERLGAMLRASTLASPHAGVVRARGGLDAATASDFVWALFTAWIGAQCPSEERWAFDALAHLGGDEAARRLSPVLKEWSSRGASPRAKSAIEILGRMGTELSLSYVQRLSETSKNKALRKKANDVLDTVAAERGLTRDDLDDRLVPDLGLGSDGFLVLDFGSRRFRAGFDSRLKPVVLDEVGARLGRLPSARKTDDEEKAERARREWKGVSKDAESILKTQARRLEGAMCVRRLWKHEAWKHWTAHPLMRHLVGSVVWEARAGTGETIGTFRVTEDGSFADERDQVFRPVLSFGCTLPHPLELPPETLEAWRTLFHDYEIVQPFPQLGRELYRADEKELASSELRRFDGRQTTTNRLMGIRHRGWREGYGFVGAGGAGGIVKRMPDDALSVFLAVEGTKLGLAYVGRDDEGIQRSRFAELDPIWLSEVVRDLEWLSIAA